MKKFCFVLFLVLIVAFGICFKSSLFSFCKDDFIETGSESVSYAGANLGFICEKVSKEYVKYEKNGEVVGECVFVEKSAVEKIASEIGLVVLKKYKIGERVVVEGVSPVLKYYVSGRQANVQICINEEFAQIGSPIIYGSF